MKAATGSGVAPSNSTVAYLFLLRDPANSGEVKHPLGDAWNKYFDGCDPGSYQVLVNLDSNNSSRRYGPQRQGREAFGPSSLMPETMHIRRFSYSIVSAKLKLMRHARNMAQHAGLATGPAWSLLFSDSCAPLLSCRAVHRYLAEHQARSFVQMDQCSPARLHGTDLKMEDCRSGLGWAGLNQEASERILEQEVQRAGLFSRTGIPDEFYWSTSLFIDRLPAWGRQLTYMRFPEWGGGAHPFTYDATQMASTRAQALKEGFVFARKFAQNNETNAILASWYNDSEAESALALAGRLPSLAPPTQDKRPDSLTPQLGTRMEDTSKTRSRLTYRHKS